MDHNVCMEKLSKISKELDKTQKQRLQACIASVQNKKVEATF